VVHGTPSGSLKKIEETGGKSRTTPEVRATISCLPRQAVGHCFGKHTEMPLNRRRVEIIHALYNRMGSQLGIVKTRFNMQDRWDGARLNWLRAGNVCNLPQENEQ